ncbi:MAG TPA: DRTGG domain-containing protein [Halanaerobiales bacterium]|nr:DRTGG domain-containing protein [Halanaerobiales bacterium]
MQLKEITESLHLEVLNEADLTKEVKGCYIGDLLSNVMARAREGDIWVTIQGHQNIVAVALLADAAAVVVAEEAEVDEKSIKRADEKDVNLLRSKLSAYELAQEFTKMGV